MFDSRRTAVGWTSDWGERGHCRGLCLAPHPTDVVVFDSYGNTHSSITLELRRRMHHWQPFDDFILGAKWIKIPMSSDPPRRLAQVAHWFTEDALSLLQDLQQQLVVAAP